MPTTTDVLDAYRSRLGRVGVWLGPLASLGVEEERVAARRLEELGFGSLWAGEAMIGKEAFSHLAVLLAATERVVVGSGIANIWARHPVSMQSGALTLGAGWPGRFVLGVGISHASLVGRTGQSYDHPLERTRRYLADMDAATEHAPVPEVPVPRLLAALRDRMLALAREEADGAHPYFVPVSHTPLSRKALGPGKLLVPEQAVVLERDPATARRLAREHTARYLQLPNYVNNLRRLGYGEDDLAGAGSDRLVDDVVAWGDEESIVARVRAHLDGGADHVVVQALGEPAAALAQLERLAPALIG